MSAYEKGRIAVELDVNVTIESPCEIKPYTFPAVNKIETFTVLTSDSNIVEQLAELQVFRVAVLRAVVRALRRSWGTRILESRHANIEMWTGYREKPEGLVYISIEQYAESPLLWSISISSGKLSPREDGQRFSGPLADILRLFRDALEERTAAWLAQIPFSRAA